MHSSVHRNEIVAVFIADKIGARALEARSLWPIANNNQSTPETLDRAGVIQELGQMFLPGDSANETKYNRLGIPIARGHHVGRREPPNIDKRRGVKQLPTQHAAQELFGPARVRDQTAALPVNELVPPMCEHSCDVAFQPRRDEGWQIFVNVCWPIGVIKADARF